jgi:hypothetical protein
MIGIDPLDVAAFQTWSNELIGWYTKWRGLGVHATYKNY